MTDGLVVRNFEAHEWRVYRDLRLGALADSPDAFGTTLSHEQTLGDEHWSGRLGRGKPGGRDCPVLAEFDGEPVGLAWGRIEDAEPDKASLYQMWVDPKFRSRGASRMLLDAVVRWAESSQARYLELGLTQGNVSALRLYQSAGFEPHGEPEPLRPGSALLSQETRLPLGSTAT